MKKNNHKKQQGGFLELVVIVLVALILLKFLNIDINAFFTKIWVQEFITYTKEMLLSIWRDLVGIYYALIGS
jgi:hypothetical protein